MHVVYAWTIGPLDGNPTGRGALYINGVRRIDRRGLDYISSFNYVPVGDNLWLGGVARQTPQFGKFSQLRVFSRFIEFDEVRLLYESEDPRCEYQHNFCPPPELIGSHVVGVDSFDKRFVLMPRRQGGITHMDCDAPYMQTHGSRTLICDHKGWVDQFGVKGYPLQCCVRGTQFCPDPERSDIAIRTFDGPRVLDNPTCSGDYSFIYEPPILNMSSRYCPDIPDLPGRLLYLTNLTRIGSEAIIHCDAGWELDPTRTIVEELFCVTNGHETNGFWETDGHVRAEMSKCRPIQAFCPPVQSPNGAMVSDGRRLGSVADKE